MSTAKNPYRPGVGLVPTYLAGRESEQTRFASVLRGAPEIPANARITGLRGVGKTVLLKTFRDIAEDAGWATLSLEVEPRHNDEGKLGSALAVLLQKVRQDISLGNKLRKKLSTATSAVRGLVKVEYEGIEWSLSGDLDQATHGISEDLLETAKLAVSKGRVGLALMLDEAQLLVDSKSADGTHPLSSLIAATSTLQKQGIPISLTLCGLPTLAVNLLAARTYSERMFQGFKVASLDEPAAKEAFLEPLRGGAISADDALVARVMKEVQGYPYFIQLWGAELWDTAQLAGLNVMTTGMLDEIEDRIYRRLDLDFYEPRIASLTPAEQDLLLDTVKCEYPPIMVNKLNEKSAKTPGNVNVLLGRLVTANILYRQRKGQYLYTAPGFREFLQRRSDEDGY